MAILSWLWGGLVYGVLGVTLVALAFGLLNCIGAGVQWAWQRLYFAWRGR